VNITSTTWKQFKDYVESKGVTDSMEIEYIDISLSYNTENGPSIEVDVQTNINSFKIRDL
jgi:hypothetical protein